MIRICGKDPYRLPKIMINGAPRGKKERCRPRHRRIEDLEDDFRMMGIYNWKSLAGDHEAWEGRVAEAQVPARTVTPNSKSVSELGI